MPAPVRNDLGNKITFLALDAISEGQPVQVHTVAMTVKLFKTAGGRPDGVATNNVKAGEEVSVTFPPAAVPIRVGNQSADLAVTAGARIKTTAQGNWSLELAGDGATTIYPAKALAATGKDGLGTALLLPYGEVHG